MNQIIPSTILEWRKKATLRNLILHIVFFWYTWLALGLPLSIPVELAVNKQSNTPFPCQNKSCGCRSAEQCYRNCCCHSPAERRAFAEKQGLNAHQLGIPADNQAPAQPVKNCCATNKPSDAKPASCCAAKSNTQKPSCCRQSTAVKQSTTAPSHHLTIVPLEALKCQGHAVTAIGVPVSIVVEWPEYCFALQQTGYCFLTIPLISSRSDDPTTPPPRTELS